MSKIKINSERVSEVAEQIASKGFWGKISVPPGEGARLGVYVWERGDSDVIKQQVTQLLREAGCKGVRAEFSADVPGPFGADGNPNALIFRTELAGREVLRQLKTAMEQVQGAGQGR